MAASGSAFKDVVLAVAIVGGVLGGLFLYTGVWPPMVVVESGSMMHGVTCPPPPGQEDLCDSQVGYGKLGTIDPGDMVFVKTVADREDVAPMAEAAAKNAGERNYGKPGDVVVYFPNCSPRQQACTRTPIIHRAIAWVDVQGVTDEAACERTGSPGQGVRYTVFWEGRTHTFDSRGIYLPSMGFGGGSASAYNENEGYRPCWSGFITKGDNPVSNTLPDQALGGGLLPRQPVRVDWVQGKAVGELPWFGLIKLALSGDVNYPCVTPGGGAQWRPNEPACDNGRAVRVLNAFAPADLWVMLGVSLAVIAVAPLAYDMYVLRAQKQRAATVAAGGEPEPSLRERVEGLVRGLRRPKDGPPPPEQGAADPSNAFEPPPSPPTGGSGASPPPGASPGTKFERVRK